MKQHNQVVKKIGRAGLVGLFATALAFAGIAPAGALEGDAASPGGVVNSIARIQLPKRATVDGGKTFNFLDVCNGVLISPSTVLTVRKCLPNSLSPYDIINGRMGTQIDGLLQSNGTDKIAPVRVTFGSSALPKGAGSTYDANQVFMGTEVYKDLGVTPLALLELDRPVPDSIAKPVAPKDMGEAGYALGITGNVYGWADVAGEPKMLKKSASLDTPYLVNGTGTVPKRIDRLWELFTKAPQDFTGTETGSDAGMGQVANENVRKGFGISTVRFHGNDDGAPFFSDSGELAAMHIGSGVLLDLGQERLRPLLGYTMTPYENKWRTKTSKIDPSNMPKKLDELQNYVCNTRDGKLLQGYKLDENDDGVLKELDTTNITVTEQPDDTLKTNSLETEEIKPIKEACEDGSGVKDPASLQAILSWAEEINKNLDETEKEITKQKQLLDMEKQTAAANKLKFDDAATLLQSHVNGGFSPEVYNQQRDTLGNDNALNTLPQKFRDGIKITPQKVKKDDATVIDDTEVILLPPITSDMDGETVLKELRKALPQAKVHSEVAGSEFTDAESKLKSVTEKANNIGQSKQYAKSVTAALEQVFKDAADPVTGIVPVIQDNWKKTYDEKNKQFVVDYKGWRDEINKVAVEAGETQKSLESVEQEITNNTKPSECDTAPDGDICKTWNSKKAELESKKSELEQKKRELVAKYNSLKDGEPKTADDKYKVVQDSAALAEALNKMPHLMSVAQHYGFVLQDIDDSYKDRPYKYQPEIEANANQIKALLDESNNQLDQIRWNSRDINKLYGQLEKKIPGAPEKIRSDLELYKNNILQNSQTMTDVQLAAQQAVKKLEELYKLAQKAPSTDMSRKYLVDAGKARKQIDTAWKTAQTAFENAQKAMDKANHKIKFPNGDDEEDDETAGMTPEEKRKYQKEKAERERKEREEAEKKAKEEADKKAKEQADKTAKDKAEADKKAAEKKKAEEEKKKKDADQKKDEQRLAKALSKNTLRAEGSDRVLTAIAAWKMGKFPGDSLVLVDGNVHADGLSATPFAAALKAPVLLTSWKTGLEPALMDQIKASGKKKLYLVGGQVPMTPYDEFELRDAGLDVYRIAGPDRYATSVAVNQATEPLIGAKPQKPIHLYVGDGVGFPDALAAGAAAGRTGGLMLLSKGDQLDPQTYNYISNLGQTRPLKITAVGGPAVKAVKNTPWPTTMSININPIMGKDRYETAAQISSTLPGTKAAVLATGEKFPDALAGGALAVDQNATLILTKPQELPPSSYQSLRRYGTDKTIVMGGKAAVSPKVAELVNGAALQNTNTKTVLGTLLESKKLKEEQAKKKQEERNDALNKVKDMIKDQSDLQKVLSQLGIGSITDLTRLLNNEKTDKDKDSTTTGSRSATLNDTEPAPTPSPEAS